MSWDLPYKSGHSSLSIIFAVLLLIGVKVHKVSWWLVALVIWYNRNQISAWNLSSTSRSVSALFTFFSSCRESSSSGCTLFQWNFRQQIQHNTHCAAGCNSCLCFQKCLTWKHGSWCTWMTTITCPKPRQKCSCKVQFHCLKMKAVEDGMG